MKYAFIRDHLARLYPVRVCCTALRVSRSGYYAARDRDDSPRRQRHRLLARQVRLVHEETRQAYGSPRVCRELQRRGIAICRNTAASIMREAGLRSRRSRRFRPRTTDSSRTVLPAPNLLRHLPSPDNPGLIWVADITYIRTERGFVYLAAVMDLCSRRIVGWSLGDSLRPRIAEDALHSALQKCRPLRGLVHHSDRGIQYDSASYRTLLDRNGIIQSMSRKGDCYDNAAMESFFATLKSELIGDHVFTDQQQTHDALFRFIEGFYNNRRLHSSIGYRSPVQLESATV